MLIAEEYLLLTMDDSGSSMVPGRELAVAGALLSELADREKVMLDDRGRIEVVDPAPTGDEVLDEALERVAAKAGRKPQDALWSMSQGMNQRLLQRLSVAEVVQERPTTVLGRRLFSTWPLVDPAPRDRAREDLVRVLSGGSDPDGRTGALISLLDATRAWDTALPRDERQGLTREQLSRRAKEVREGRWGGEAVRGLLEAIGAALLINVVID